MRRRSESGVWWASPYVAGYLALMPTVLGIFLIVHQLTLHDVIGGVTLPGGAVNFASSVALSKGQLPYDNFVLTQPPGMSILLLPFAWIAHSNGSAGVDAARAFTAAVAVVDVFLVAYIARFHGTASTFVAGVLFAVFPNAFYATASMTVEPYLLLFCLLAFQAAFTQGQLAAGGRLIFAGGLIGFAITLKPWAIIPAVVLLVCAAVQWRQALGRVVGGLVIGVGVPCITFVLASPSAFARDVVTAELSRGYGAAAPGGLGARIAEILGLGSALGITNGNSLALAIGVVLVVVILVAVATRASTASTLDWALLATVVGLAAIAIVPHDLPSAYTYFLAGFGAILIGNSIGTLIAVLSSLGIGSGEVSSTAAAGITVMCIAAMVVVVSLAAPKETDYWRSYFLKNATNPSPTVVGAVPKGACVVSNNPEALVIADRFAALPSACPYVVDPQGIARVAGSASATNAQWEQLWDEARYVVIAPGQPKLLASVQLRRFLASHFSLVHNAQYQIYLSNSSVSGP